METVRKNLALSVCTFLILCFGLSVFQLSVRDSLKDTNQVFCPLQKAWVKQTLPQPKISRDFNDFCATDKRKDFLKLEISLKKGFFQPITEKLIFNYLAKDGQALIEFKHFPDLPNRQFSRQAKFQTAANSFFQEFGKRTLVAFTLSPAARPPTFTSSVRFEFQFVLSLKQISRNINPRSPPLILS